MIVFKTIRYKNFQSTGNKFIEIFLNKNPSTLIVGKNGAGKSQMIDALCFTLYGKAFRKITLGQLVNTINKKKTVVELEFSIANIEYKIVRSITPANFEIWINGKLKIQEASLKDYQRFLENNILKMNEKTFRQIIVLGSTSYIPFMRLTAADRRYVVEDLLNIGIFSIMNHNSKLELNEINTKYKEAIQDLKLLNNSLELKMQHFNELSDKSAENITKNNNEMMFLDGKLKDIIKDDIAIRSNIADMMQTINDENKTRASERKLDNLKSQISKNKDNYNGKIDFFENSTECPTCQQDIDEDFKCEHVKIIQTKVTSAEKGLLMAEDELSKIQDRINQINSILSLITVEENKIIHNGSESTSIKAYIAKLVTDNKKMIALNKSVIDEKDLEFIKEDINKYNGKRDKLSNDAFYYGALVEMLKDGGIKTKIIRSYLPIINKLIRKYLDILEFNIDFVFDESFSETIVRDRNTYSYSMFSEGEKMRFDLCLLFTWRELSRLINSASTNILIFDEIGDSSLDDEGFESFMKIINDSAKNQNVFIISHKVDIMSDKFRNIIKFEKKGHFTEIG